MSVMSAKNRKPIKKIRTSCGRRLRRREGSRCVRRVRHPPPDAITPSVGTPPTPMAVARALRHGGHVACLMMLAAQAPAPATATASSSLRREERNGG